MKKLLLSSVLMMALCAGVVTNALGAEKQAQMKFLNLRQVSIDDPFWSPKLQTWDRVTACDVLDKFEGKHTDNPSANDTFANFDRVAAGRKGTGDHFGAPWFDGLVYETIRGISDYLTEYPDPEMEARLDGYIARIAAAQEADAFGYLNTYTDLNEREHRWGENGGFLRWQHDIYNSGMLIEAGIHYYRATGKTELLTVATRLANLMCDQMGPAPKKNRVPSHSGPEEALIKLHWLYLEKPELKKQLFISVRPQDYLSLAKFWIDSKGDTCGLPDWEKWGGGEAEKWIRQNNYADPMYGNHSRPTFGDYAQDRIPILQQKTIEGHAVRATLLATGLATLAEATGDKDYFKEAEILWDNMTAKRMFITGGVGAIHEDEKFGPDYFLPTDAYLETCAAIGAAFFSGRMAELTQNGMYMDELERVLYNSLLTAVSISGTNYTYQNPLNANKHNRWAWHGCPCCPPMFLKITGALPEYIYSQSQSGDTVFVNLFIGSKAQMSLPDKSSVLLEQQTEYPWKGTTEITVNPAGKADFTVAVRIPGWAKGIENHAGLYTSDLKAPISLSINGKTEEVNAENGYVYLKRTWTPGDKIQLVLPMQPRVIRAHPLVEATKGQVALASGPVVYCFENCDNPQFDQLELTPQTRYALEYHADLPGGANMILCEDQTTWKAIPYYAIANRQKDSSHKVFVPMENE